MTWKKALYNSFWKMYLESSVSLSFCVLSLFLVNASQTLYVNLGYFKCISSMSLSPANKNLLIFHKTIKIPLKWVVWNILLPYLTIIWLGMIRIKKSQPTMTTNNMILNKIKSTFFIEKRIPKNTSIFRK